MFRPPDIDDVMAIGRSLKLDLTSEEGVLVKGRLDGLMQTLNRLYELRAEEETLSPKYPTRDLGHRPTDEEDPLNAFLWKCDIKGRDEGRLVGKTVALKDHIAVAGIPLTLGSHFFDGYIPDFDATVVTRLLDNGATIVGKLNMEDFSAGAGLAGVPDFGRVLNPRNVSHVTGGSSSGAGAAVAGKCVDIAIGGDQGGSIRGPAHYCGIVGLKPTFSLVPHTGVVGLDARIDHVGPMARRVDDIAAVLECIAGPDGHDLRQIDVPPVPRYSDSLNVGIDGLKIGVLSEAFGSHVDSEVEEKVMDAVDRLAKAGASVEKVSIPAHDTAWMAFMAVMMEGVRHIYDTNLAGNANHFYPTSLMTAFGRFKQANAYELPPNVKVLLIAATYTWERYHGRLSAKAKNMVGPLRRKYDEALAQFDVIALPTKPTAAPAYETPRDYGEALRHDYRGFSADHTRNTAPFNLTGHPAITIPCRAGDGLPVGLQLVAAHFREDTLLRVAAVGSEVIGFG